MANRQLTGTGKDRDGDIASVCGPWGRASKAEAITDIERELHRYYVRDGLGRTADVHVVKGPTGKHLWTSPNAACSDNLDNLPDC